MRVIGCRAYAVTTTWSRQPCSMSGGGRDVGGGGMGSVRGGGRARLELRVDGEGVFAADAVAEAGDVGAVDVHGDGDGIAAVADAVDVTGRCEAAHGPGLIHV